MPEGDTQAKSNDFELYLIVSSLQRNLLYHIANSGLFIGQIFARFYSVTTHAYESYQLKRQIARVSSIDVKIT